MTTRHVGARFADWTRLEPRADTLASYAALALGVAVGGAALLL